MERKVTKELLERVLPEWSIYQDSDSSFEVTRHSPAGEEIVMDLSGENLGEMARFSEEYYNGFDPQDHAAQIYHAKHYGSEDEQRFYSGAPADLEALLEDAKAIDEMYYSVYTALRRAWEEEPDDAEGEEQHEV